MALPYVYALFANMFWGFAAQVYTEYGRKFSALWINCFKAFISGICFAGVVLFFGGFHHIPLNALGAFLISGALGLGIADIFLVKSFTGMGAGRTLMLFSFQPIFVGIVSFFVFGQVLDTSKFISIIFFIICILIFSVESYRRQGHFNISSTFYALIGMMLDGIGVLFTRYGFDHATQINVFEGNLYRVISALTVYFIISRFIKFDFSKNFAKLKISSKAFVTMSVFFGTFISLSLYLSAIKMGSLAVVTAITVTGVIFASFFECVFERKMPTKYLYAAFAFFACGMYLLLF